MNEALNQSRMAADHLCVPGLKRPVALSDYAKLESVREADVLAIIGQLKIPAAFFQGQWFVEAPPNTEARLAQLRAEQRTSRNDNASAPKPIPAPVPQTASDPQVAQHPQPIDYGLSESDILLHQRYRPSADNLKYRHGRDLSVFFGLLFFIILSLVFVTTAVVSNSLGLAFLFALLSYAPAMLLWGGVISIINGNQKRRSRAAYLKFEEARLAYEAIKEAERKAARDAELRKRSYWTFLDGYAFERATAEVLNKHQFNAVVTPGSGDGGVDIEVTRNGLKGVVQCKAHMARVGPHVARDLYGVIHHRGASFGIIVSLGGFSRGAVEFTRDKSILFLDLDDLIAMQEGRDVLASAFSRKETPNQLQEARSIWSGGLANAQEGKETRQDRAAKLGDYCRFEPTKTCVTMWRMWEEGLIDLTAGDIVKVVTTPENEMCHVNKPGKWPVLMTMELVTPEWLEPVSGNFKECDYCGAIDHETSECPYRGKVPYGRKGNFSWRIEAGKTILE